MGADKEKLFLIYEDNKYGDIWHNSFDLIVTAGAPLNAFRALSSGIRFFLKYFEEDEHDLPIYTNHDTSAAISSSNEITCGLHEPNKAAELLLLGS